MKYIHESSEAPDLDNVENFARLNIKETQPRTNQGKHVYLAENGAPNIKNLIKIISELQDITRTRRSADIKQMEQEEYSAAKHVRTLKGCACRTP